MHGDAMGGWPAVLGARGLEQNGRRRVRRIAARAGDRSAPPGQIRPANRCAQSGRASGHAGQQGAMRPLGRWPCPAKGLRAPSICRRNRGECARAFWSGSRFPADFGAPDQSRRSTAPSTAEFTKGTCMSQLKALSAQPSSPGRSHSPGARSRSAAAGWPSPPLPRPSLRPRRPAAGPAAAGRPAAAGPGPSDLVAVQPEWTKVCSKDPQSQREVCLTTRDFGTQPDQPPVLAIAVNDVKGEGSERSSASSCR